MRLIFASVGYTFFPHGNHRSSAEHKHRTNGNGGSRIACGRVVGLVGCSLIYIFTVNELYRFVRRVGHREFIRPDILIENLRTDSGIEHICKLAGLHIIGCDIGGKLGIGTALILFGIGAPGEIKVAGNVAGCHRIGIFTPEKDARLHRAVCRFYGTRHKAVFDLCCRCTVEIAEDTSRFTAGGNIAGAVAGVYLCRMLIVPVGICGNTCRRILIRGYIAFVAAGGEYVITGFDLVAAAEAYNSACLLESVNVCIVDAVFERTDLRKPPQIPPAL